VTRPLKALSLLSAVISPAALAALWVAVELLRVERERREQAEHDASEDRAAAELLTRELANEMRVSEALGGGTYKLRRELRAARATADACYAIGWEAIAERDAVGSLGHALICERTAERSAAIARAEAAERASAEARANLATLRAERAAPGGMQWALVPIEAAPVASAMCPACKHPPHAKGGCAVGWSTDARGCQCAAAPVEPVAAPPVACTWCGEPAGKDWGFGLPLCAACWDDD
jgi:hypothetical protein